MNRINIFLIVGLAFVVAVIGYYIYTNKIVQSSTTSSKQADDFESAAPAKDLEPLSIESMRKQQYPGSEITIEETLSSGSNYDRYLTSYRSDDLKIYALLTVPQGEKPATGWPVVVFNHGYIPPAEYRTTERYIAYTDAFSSNGYILFRPDYRGHGDSEGVPEGGYYSPSYTVDVLNAVASIKKRTDVDINRIGMWGHSMGGHITIRSMVVTKDIKAGVIWGGVVSSYQDMAENWRRSVPWQPSQREQITRRPGRQTLIDKYGDFKKNPEFWQSISPIYHVADISGPIQLHHGTLDEEVPLLFSERLDEAMRKAGKTVELYPYEGDDHNLSGNLGIALQRSVEFFDTYVKGS